MSTDVTHSDDWLEAEAAKYDGWAVDRTADAAECTEDAAACVAADSVSHAREATREDLVRFLSPLNGWLNIDLATPWAAALLTKFTITRKGTL